MSGFVALFQRNGAPVDRPLLNGLTSFLSFRGPDAREVWHSGSIGLGHTLLRTSRSSANERQPVSIDGRCWIAADARLDGRGELRDALLGAGQRVERVATDAELILHSYSAWQDECVLRLRGDFSFAIWDAAARRVFCARDHFGVRPFYYAETEDFFVCSNTLDCVRLHPGVSDELNDEAVADFLLFGLNCNQATTTFEGVKRLPPARSLFVTAEQSGARRYWSAPVDGRIRYRRTEEYAEHFRERLRAAVADRLDVDRAGIFLSGGLDSGAVAATARDIAAGREMPTELRAYTVTYEKLIGDREGYYAKQTADFLNIPLRTLPMDHVRPFVLPEQVDFATPEPIDDPMVGGLYDQFAAVAQDCRVVLDGEGIDNLMHFQMAPYAKDLLRRGEWATFAKAGAGYLWRKRSRWRRAGARMKRVLQRESASVLPAWIAPDFAGRVNFQERRTGDSLPSVSPAHPILPDGHASLELPHWTRMFESGDAGVTRQPVEMRFPFLDLRLVEYVLALPPFPLFLEKKLERDAMEGKLPAATLRRPKTPLMGDPGAAAMSNDLGSAGKGMEWDSEIARYVAVENLSMDEDAGHSSSGNPCMRAISLNFWLQSSRVVRYNLMMEVRNG
jgi:asparagine synthase (glutamine-hydrolysing)